MFVYTIQPVVQPVVSCKRGMRNRASTTAVCHDADASYLARAEPLRSIVMSMSVCLCVCLSARLSTEPHAQSLPNFLRMLPISVARSSSGMLMIGRIAYRRERSDRSTQRRRSVIYDCLVSLAFGLVSNSVPSQETGWEKRLRNDLFCHNAQVRLYDRVDIHNNELVMHVFHIW